jgi:hypothetical protein
VTAMEQNDAQREQQQQTERRQQESGNEVGDEPGHDQGSKFQNTVILLGFLRFSDACGNTARRKPVPAG